MSARRSFPADGVVLDNCALVRLYKCEALEKLQGLTTLHVASHVYDEFDRKPAQRGLLKGMEIEREPVVPGTAVWEEFSRIRGGRFSTRDLGEDESLAVCLARARQHRLLPLVTFDMKAAADADRAGVATIDFLSLLSWLAACGSLSYEAAEALEGLAAKRNGWKRPAFYTDHLESHAEALRQATAHAIQEWRLRLGKSSTGKSRGKRRL